MTNSELIPCPTLKELDDLYRRNGFEVLDAYEWTGRFCSQVCNCLSFADSFLFCSNMLFDLSDSAFESCPIYRSAPGA